MPAGDLAPGIVGDEDGLRLTALGVRERAPGGEGAAGGQVAGSAGLAGHLDPVSPWSGSP